MTMPDALTETVAELSRLEVTLRVDHGELKYGARKGVVDAKLRRAIVGIKDVLTLAARLQQGEHPNGWRWNHAKWLNGDVGGADDEQFSKAMAA